METKQNNLTPVCPECDTPVSIGADPKLGKIIECLACGAESEIIAVSPLKLVPLEEEK